MLHPTMNKVSRYLDGELDSKTRGRVDSHLERCAACRRKVEVLRSAGRAFPPPSRERLDAVARGVMDRIGPREWNVAPGARPGRGSRPVEVRAEPILPCSRRWVLGLAAVTLWIVGILTAIYGPGLFHRTGARDRGGSDIASVPAPASPSPLVSLKADGASATSDRAGEKRNGRSFRTGAISPSGELGVAMGKFIGDAAKTVTLAKSKASLPDEQGELKAYDPSHAPRETRRRPETGSAKAPDKEKGAAGSVAVDSWDDLQAYLKNTRWQWDGEASETIVFREEGCLEHAAWAREGFDALWDPIDRRTVLLYVQRAETCDIRAILVFAEDMASFQGYNVRGTGQLKPSRKIEGAEIQPTAK